MSEKKEKDNSKIFWGGSVANVSPRKKNRKLLKETINEEKKMII